MKIKKYLPIIGIAIFLYILFKLDITNILKEFTNVDVNFLLIAIFFVFVSFITETLKWFTIAKFQMIEVSFLHALKINLITAFYAFVTPSKIGGAMRAEYLRSPNNKLGKGISNYVLDKALDLCSLVSLAIIFSFVFKDLLPINFFYYAILILVLLIVLLMIFTNKERSRSILRIFYRKIIPKKMKEKVKNGFNSFYEDMPKKRYFVLFSALNILNWIAIYTVAFFIGVALGIDVSFFYFLAIFPIATLVAQIPITISGLGTREATLISLFALVGVSATKVFSMSLINLIISGIIPAAIGSFLALKIKKHNEKSKHNYPLQRA